MFKENIRILIVEDEKYDVARIRSTLAPYDAILKIDEVVENGYDALEKIKSGKDYDVVILDYQISGGLYGEELIKKMKALEPNLQILVITKKTINQTDLNFANRLLESGAYWYGTKYPGDIEDYIYQPTDFVLSIMNAYALKQAEVSGSMIRGRLDAKIETILDQTPLVGNSTVMVQLKELITKYALPNANVLVIGESGTGKELIAKNIHYQSGRKYEAFIPVNCAAIPKDLIESELFGHEKGSFTGADSARTGYFEQADKGTIFLDEVTELPPSSQAKLLRVLQEGEIDKIGRKKSHKVDVRVLAATNRNIEDLSNENILRQDLFYRLNILEIDVPPLKDRKGDVAILVDHFIHYFCEEMGRDLLTVDSNAMLLLDGYSWPGNVRQLKNVIQRIVILASENMVTEELVRTCMKGSINLQTATQSSTDFLFDETLPMKDMDKLFKRKYIEYIRSQSRTDTEAADKLGMAPSNFYRLCKDLGIK